MKGSVLILMMTEPKKRSAALFNFGHRKILRYKLNMAVFWCTFRTQNGHDKFALPKKPCGWFHVQRRLFCIVILQRRLSRLKSNIQNSSTNPSVWPCRALDGASLLSWRLKPCHDILKSSNLWSPHISQITHVDYRPRTDLYQTKSHNVWLRFYVASVYAYRGEGFPKCISSLRTSSCVSSAGCGCKNTMQNNEPIKPNTDMILDILDISMLNWR